MWRRKPSSEGCFKVHGHRSKIPTTFPGQDEDYEAFCERDLSPFEVENTVYKELRSWGCSQGIIPSSEAIRERAAEVLKDHQEV